MTELPIRSVWSASVWQRPFLSLGCVTLLVFLSSCETTAPITTFKSTSADTIVKFDKDVVVLPPLLTYENLHNEENLSPESFGSTSVKRRLFNSARRAVGAGKNGAIALKRQVATEKEGIITRISTKIPRLSQGRSYEDVRSLISELEVNDGNPVLVNYVRVKVGTQGSWNPNSGAITSTNSRSVFNSALIRSDTGQVLWKKQVLLRNVPDLSDDKFNDALSLLFNDFPM